MIAITTSSSISVKPNAAGQDRELRGMMSFSPVKV